MRKSAALVAILFVFLLPDTSYANDFVRSSTRDWFRYSDGRSEVESRIELTDSGWLLFSNFGGLGPRWVYTESSHDYVWVYSEDTGYGEVIGNLDGRRGQEFDVHLDRRHTGTFEIRATGARVTTPAGTFDDVTELAIDGPYRTVGVATIWFARGVGIVKWAEKSRSGLRTFELTAAQVAGRNLPGQNRGGGGGSSSTPTASGRTVAPGEWEPVDAIMWGANDTYLVLDTYADAFRALDGRRPRVVSEVFVDSDRVASELRYEMRSRNVPLDDVEIIVTIVDSVWMRDYGPVILRDGSGQRVVADMNYYPDRPADDDIPLIYANYKGWPVVWMNANLEGGNFFSDGAARGFFSNGAQWFNDHLSDAALERQLTKLGVDELYFFEPLVNEGTTHIDMFAKLVSPTRAVVSSYPDGHRQKRVVDAAASRLRSLGYTVSRIRAEYSHDEYATYANSVLANGVALVPQYGHGSRDANARAAYTRAGFEAIGVDCELLIQYGGAIHCIAMQVPR